MFFRSLSTLGAFITDQIWPTDFISPPNLPEFLNNLYVSDYKVETLGDKTIAHLWLAVQAELVIHMPGLDGVDLLLAPGPSGYDATSVSEAPEEGFDPDPDPEDPPSPYSFNGFTFFYVQLLLTEVGLVFPDLRLVLRFKSDLLHPVDAAGKATTGPVEIVFPGALRIDSNFELHLDGFDSVNLPPVMIGTSGVVISAANVKLDLSRTSSPPEIVAAGFDESFLGVFIGNASLTLPGGLLGPGAETITLTNAALGSGGVSGTASLPLQAPVFNEMTNTYNGPRAGTLFGVPFWLSSVNITVKANAFVEAKLIGEMFMPFFDRRVQVRLGFDGNGGLLLQVEGGGGSGSLFTVQVASGVQLTVLSLAVEEKAGKGLFRLDTNLTVTNVGGITSWPSPRINGLLIDSDGNVQIDGGWIDLPKQATLDLHGFKMELTKIGFGKEDSGDRWIGFSGGLKLVDGIKAGASVKGLRIIWRSASQQPDISLEGVGIDFEIPNSLSVTGAVSLVGENFSGAVKVVVKPISLTIDGQFLTGRVASTGERYFGILLHGELPTGIPLGATGLAIYGFAGLYGQNLAPGKRADEDWFENPDGTPGWYKRSPAGVDDLVNKWSPTPGAFAFGAGVTLGTYSDNGYQFSGRLLLVLSFPGPTILIDGRANLFKKRSELSGNDPTFRALAVIQPGKSFLLGLDAHYKYKANGKLLDLKGSAEAFFDFNNAGNWHIFIGRKDPALKKRIAARLFKLYDVNGYFELTPTNLAVGAGWSFDKSYGFSSLKVHVQASLQEDAVISWHPNHFTGSVILDGSAGLSAFGHGIGVHAHADISGDVFEPFHLHGGFSVGIDLPWPLPNLGGTINFDWQETLTSAPPLPLPLREATVEHTKRMLKWPIPRNGNSGALLPDNNAGGDLELPGSAQLGTVPPVTAPVPAVAPKVPADSAIGLSFSRPISDGAGVSVNPTGVGKETIGDVSNPKNPVGPYSAFYQLSTIALEKRVPAPETVTGASPLPPRWVKVAEAHGKLNQPGVPQLFAAWSPSPPAASNPAANSEQLKLLVNAKTPFDYTSQQLKVWDTWFDDANQTYPCQPPAVDPNQKFCATFITANLPSEGNEIEFVNPAFSVSWIIAAELVNSSEQVPGGGGSHRSLGVVATLDGNEVLVIPPEGVDEVDLRVGSVDGIETLVPMAPDPDQVQGDNVVMPAAVISTFNLDDANDPNADVTPGPGLGKSVLPPSFNPNGSLKASDLTEITLRSPATEAVNIDLDVQFTLGIDNPGGTDMAQVVFFDDTGTRTVLTITQLVRQRVLVKNPPSRIVRVAVRTAGRIVASLFGVHVRTPVSAFAVSREGSDVFGPYEEDVNGLIKVLGDDIGVVKVGTPTPCEFTILELCTPDRRLELERRTISSLDLLKEESAIFDPQADYRLVVTTLRGDHTTRRLSQNKDDAGIVNFDLKLVEQAYFHVVGPPGIEAPDRPVATPPSPTGPTGFEDLGFYVASTIPDSTPASDGKPVIPRAFYRAYDVSFAFNEPSTVEKMYRLARRDLTLRLFDAANTPVFDADGRAIIATSRWDTAPQPTLTDAQQRWVARVNAAACRPTNIPPFDPKDALTNQLVSAPAEIVLLPEALYQARLVPALLHEAFVNSIPGLAADGKHELERWIAVNDDPANPGRWVVDSADVIGPNGQPVIGPDGKHVKTFFVTETTGKDTTLLYRGPLGAAPGPDQPTNWSDFRASVQFRWAVGVVALQLRYVSPNDRLSIAFDRSTGARSVVAVIGSVQTLLSTDQPNFGSPESDLVVTADCTGNRLQVFQFGAPTLDLELPAGTPTAGSLGLFGSFVAGCRFTEIRVDDLRPPPAPPSPPAPTPSTALRFDFITSKYVNFAHHLATFDDRVFEVPATLGVTANDLSARLPAAVAILAGGPAGFGLAPPSDAEKRAFEELELLTLGLDGRLRAPAAIEILNATHDPKVTALLIRSPEPFQWERTHLAARAPVTTPHLGIPGDVKMVAVSFGSTPPEESITLLVRTGQRMTGFTIQWRHVVDASNPDPGWTTYYAFGSEPVFQEGTSVLVFSGSSADAPPREPGTQQRFVALDPTSAAVVFPTDSTGVELRVIDVAGNVVHQREFKPITGLADQVGVNVIRKGDGTSLFLFLTPQPTGTRPAGMRLDLMFTRNPGSTVSPQPFPILRQAGSDTSEVAVFEFALE